MTADDLPRKARLRLEHAGKWVAWSEDLCQIVASGDDTIAVRTAARSAGFERSPMEWLEPMPPRTIDERG